LVRLHREYCNEATNNFTAIEYHNRWGRYKKTLQGEVSYRETNTDCVSGQHHARGVNEYSHPLGVLYQKNNY